MAIRLAAQLLPDHALNLTDQLNTEATTTLAGGEGGSSPTTTIQRWVYRTGSGHDIVRIRCAVDGRLRVTARTLAMVEIAARPLLGLGSLRWQVADGNMTMFDGDATLGEAIRQAHVARMRTFGNIPFTRRFEAATVVEESEWEHAMHALRPPKFFQIDSRRWLGPEDIEVRSASPGGADIRLPPGDFTMLLLSTQGYLGEFFEAGTTLFIRKLRDWIFLTPRGGKMAWKFSWKPETLMTLLERRSTLERYRPPHA